MARRRCRSTAARVPRLASGAWFSVLSGKVIVTCSLPMNADDTDLVIAHTSSGAEALAKSGLILTVTRPCDAFHGTTRTGTELPLLLTPVPS
jgi:hypothetical protein